MARPPVETATSRRATQPPKRRPRCWAPNPPRFLGLPDNRLDSLPILDVVQGIEEIVREIRPGIVYTHHGGDLNIDHRIAHQAVVTACRPLPDAATQALYAFEVPSSTEWSTAAIGAPFVPTRHVDIAAQLGRKLEALSCYADELRPYPHPRSPEAIRALAQWRGATAGLDSAEAFVVLRQVVA